MTQINTQTLLKHLFNYLLSAAIIFACLLLGKGIQHILGLTLPASIIGMILLFLLLASGLIKEKWVAATSNLFLRYLLILFIPISVGLIDNFDLLIANALPLFLATVVATVIVLVIVSLILQKILSNDSPKQKENQ